MIEDMYTTVTAVYASFDSFAGLIKNILRTVHISSPNSFNIAINMSGLKKLATGRH